MSGLPDALPPPPTVGELGADAEARADGELPPLSSSELELATDKLLLPVAPVAVEQAEANAGRISARLTVTLSDLMSSL